jgi:hypothetical protein
MSTVDTSGNLYGSLVDTLYTLYGSFVDSLYSCRDQLWIINTLCG